MDDDEVTEVDLNEEVDQIEDEPAEDVNDSDDESTREAEKEEEAEEVISFGDESQESEDDKESAHQRLIRLRQESIEKDRLIEELKQRSAPVQPHVSADRKPQLSDEDIDHDEDAYSAKLLAWQKAVDARAAEQDAWVKRVDAYKQAGKDLKVKSFASAEIEVQEKLSLQQQGFLLQALKDPALSAKFVFALGKNPTALKELAATKDPIEFVVKVTERKALLLAQAKKVAPSGKRPTAPSDSVSGKPDLDKVAERLLDKAMKTGDMTEYSRYTRKLRAVK
jgi:hypothetical protein